jgi:hypothetical protein
MTVHRQDASRFRVVSVDRMDWADIFIAEGQRGDGGRWGSISFVSSFGNRGHLFGAIGDRPFALWITGCDWPYIADKCWGLESREFDFDASIKELKRRICESRRNGYMKQCVASDCWGEIIGLERVHEESAFGWQLMGNCPELMKSAQIFEHFPSAQRNNPQCDGFRDSIWTPFCEWVREHQAEFA